MKRADFERIASELAGQAPSDDELRAAEEETQRELRAERLERSGVRGAITAEDCDFICADALPESTHALQAVQRWLVGRARSPRPYTTLALMGETGRGKTVAGAWLISKLGGYYVTADTVRRLSTSKSWHDAQRLEQIMAGRVLVVDDIGTEQRPDESVPAFYEVINGRIGLARGWTLITGNISKSVFCERYGERTIRRIEHRGGILTVKGPDLRLGAKGQ